MPIEITNHATVMTGDGITLFRMLSLRGRMRLELAGMKSRSGSTFALVKKEFGLKGSNQSVFDQFQKLVDDKNTSVQRITEEVSNG